MIKTRPEIINQLASEYPIVLPFIPTTAIIHKLILKTAQFQSQDDVTWYLNPKERRRLDDNDLEEDICEGLDDLRVKSRKISYPDVCNYPEFFE